MNEAAATEFRHVIDCAPRFALGYVKLGSVLCFLERTEEGRRLFERSVEIEPTFYALSNLGTIYFNAARYADAAGMYERALALNDTDYALWGNLAYARRFGTEPEKARAAFQRAAAMGEARLRASPDDVSVATDLADYYAMLGEPGRGLTLIERVVAARPTDPQVIANVAECLWDLGDRTRAVEWVGRALEAGIPRSRFEGRPTLRDLVADERYRALVAAAGGAR
jgi:tetratricopeptide (TPR) repeat protein